MAAVIAWLVAHWASALVTLLAVDKALISIFPNVTLLAKLKQVLSDLGAKE